MPSLGHGKQGRHLVAPLQQDQAFSIETAGTFDRDAELEMYFSGLGKVRLEFSKNFNLSYVAKRLAGAIL